MYGPEHGVDERSSLDGGESRAAISIAAAGNWLVAHDRVGPRVLQLLRDRYDHHVEVIEIGTAAFALIDVLRGQPLLLVVDAGRFGGKAGEIRVIDPDLEAMDGRVTSVHQIGPLETLRVACRLYPEQIPGQVRLILVETGGLSEDGLERACTEVVGLLDDHVARFCGRARTSR